MKSAPVDDPRWARDAGAADDPLAVYADTYSAMSGMPPERRPRRRRARRRVVSLLVVAAAATVGAGWWTGMLSLPDFAPTTESAPPLPVPRSAYAPDVIGTTPCTTPVPKQPSPPKQNDAELRLGSPTHALGNWTTGRSPLQTCGSAWTSVATTRSDEATVHARPTNVRIDSLRGARNPVFTERAGANPRAPARRNCGS